MKNLFPKEPWLAVFLSSIIPGLGQMYSQRKLRGLAFLIILFGFGVIFLMNILFLILNEERAVNLKQIILIGIWGLIGILIYIYMLFDSHRCAREFNRENNIESDKTRKKSPWLAVFLSEIIPGLGQFYNKQLVKGISFIIIGIVFYNFNRNIFILFFLPIIFKMIVLSDAFQTAEKINGRKSYLLRQAHPIIVFFLIVGWLLTELPYSSYIKNYMVEAFRISDDAMKPVINSGDRVLVNKMSYKKDEPQRGDLLAFVYIKNKRKISLIRRIVGLPGENVEIKNGRIYINNSEINLPKLNKNYYYNKGNFGKEGLIVNIPADSYYVLGDNSMESWDSRDFGFINKKDILGKVYKIYYPFEHSGKIE